MDKEQRDSREIQVQQDHQEFQGEMVKMDEMAIQDLLVQEETLDHQESLVKEDLLVLLAHRDIQEQLGQQVHQVHQESLEIRVCVV